jgi:hypothetical protein
MSRWTQTERGTWRYTPNKPITLDEASGSYEDMTKDELSDELARRGLPKSGNKDELIARLEEADNA